MTEPIAERRPLTQYFVASSIDGFIADAHDNLDWLLQFDGPDDANPYERFILDVGPLAMGATTYEWIQRNDPGEWAYGDRPCWVFTHRDLPVVPGSGILFTSADVATVHQEMVAAADGRNVWVVGGGDLAGQFADVGLLDELILSIAPITLGAGAPLLPRRIELKLEDVARNGDFACVRYSVVTEAD